MLNSLFKQYKTVGTFIFLGCLLSVTIGIADPVTANSSKHFVPKESFSSIEQPISLKIGVTAGGLALIGLEVWWFVISKSKSRQSSNNDARLNP